LCSDLRFNGQQHEKKENEAHIIHLDFEINGSISKRRDPENQPVKVCFSGAGI
jgi:hypothetical protein